MVAQASQSLRRRVASFAILQVSSLITPFIVLPVLARTTSTSGWAAIAIGQSVGGILAIIVAWGWPLMGPARIAKASFAEARAEYLDSFRVRLWVLGSLLPLAVAASWVLGPSGFKLECLLMTVAGGVFGLSPAWFAIGTGRPSILAKFELIPRAIAMLMAAVVMILTQAIFVYPILLLAAGLLGQLFFVWKLSKKGRPSRIRKPIGVALKENATAVLAEMLGGTYSTSTTALVAVSASTQAAASYSAAEKVYRIGLFGVSAVSNALQGWIGSAPASERGRRLRVSLLIHLSLGIVGALVLLSFGPWLTELLFTSQLRASWSTCAWLGVAYLAISVNTSLGRHFLALAGRLRPVLVSTAIGGVVGVPTILLAAMIAGSEGAAAALATGEVIVVIVQVIAIRNVRHPNQDASVRSDDIESRS